MKMAELNPWTIRDLERASILAFMTKYKYYLRGRVLDYGAGKQPYKDLVEGQYVPFEQGDKLPEGRFNVVMCNQVFQYIEDVPKLLIEMNVKMLNRGGYLVCTYPTNWDLIEEEDYWRFTPFGMSHLLAKAGFTVLHHDKRAEIDLNGFHFPLGFGFVAQT